MTNELKMNLGTCIGSSRMTFPMESINLSPEEQMKATKDAVQHEAIESVLEKFKNANKTVLNLAPGVGKTRTAWKLVFQNDQFQTILFMVPKISLVDQTIQEWEAQGIEFDHATIYSKGNVNSALELELFLNRQTGRKKVIFAVYNTVGVAPLKPNSIFLESDTIFDLAIYDECHRVSGKEMGLFTSCVTDQIVKAKYKLFMTATIKFYTSDVEEGEEGVEDSLNEFSMMNEDLFGEIAYSVPISTAISLGILCDFEPYLLEVSDNSIRKALKGIVEFHGEAIEGKHLAAFYAMLNAYNQGSRKILTLFHTIADANDFANLFLFLQKETGLLQDAIIASVASNATPSDLGAPHSYVNDNGNTIIIGKSKRRAQQWWLKNGPFSNSKTGIATSTPWIKEGEDVPCIDCIVFGDRFKSGIDIVQIMGRALRWYPGKEVARIILPIMEGEANKAARIIQSVVGAVQTNVKKAEVLYSEIDQQQTTTQSDIEPEDTDNDDLTNTDPIENRGSRWILNDDQTDVTTLVTTDDDDNTFSITVVHDTHTPQQTRYQHQDMLRVIGLKSTNDYNKFVKDRSDERWINNIIYNIELAIQGGVRTDARKIYLDDHYYNLFAQEFSTTVDDAKERLATHMHKIADLRKKVLFGL